jgi:hypothetical protein
VMAYPRHRSADDVFNEFGRLMFVLIPLCACLPFAWVLNPPWRTYWINEFLRSDSRQQQIRTTGFALAVSSLVGSSLLIVIPFLAIWIATGVCPATREFQGAIAISFCGMPLFFALGAGNWPRFRAYLSLVVVVLLYAAVVWTPMLSPNSVSTVGIAARAIFLVIAGTGLAAAAYRSWLERDLA